MENFIKDYVEMIAESQEINLTEKQINKIVNNLMNEDEIWDMFDTYINEEIKNLLGGK